MKVNKEKLERLSALDDSALWSEIRTTAEKFGYILPVEIPPKKDMEKLRSIMRNADGISPMELLRLMAAFKAKRGKE